MTQSVSFPSEAFPAFPEVSVQAPDDWQPINAYGSVLAVAEPVEAGRFRSNVVVALSRFGADYELKTAIEAVEKKFGEQTDIAVIGKEEREVLGVPGFRMEVSFSDPRVGTLAQAVHIALIRSGGVSDLVQITGSAAGEHVKTVWPTIRGILDSATTGAAA
ncbi:hypothetical protein ACFSBZ_15015 [Amnibacterium flavum]|uniref:DUF1795 domain-containing protein n=1 Tax=Amnibacterium flavum TaxID=2173173 RepID=A0A2V1HTY4_9MICO|nr:hypothetical protein [Amnibacterium flavum]PVZ96033.1 hypothetical protein DDQ50_06210 [Amnibacterium flavum]